MSLAVSLKKPQNAEFLHCLIMLGIPAAVQSLLSTSMSAIDTLMVSSQGELAVAAVGVCNQFTHLFSAGICGFYSGGALFIAQYWGAKDKRGISRSFGLMSVFLILIGFLFSGASFFFPGTESQRLDKIYLFPK